MSVLVAMSHQFIPSQAGSTHIAPLTIFNRSLHEGFIVNLPEVPMVGSPNEGQGLLNMDGIFTPKERERLLVRLNSLFAWVGARIPELVELDGREVRLRELLNNLMSQPDLDDDELEFTRSLEGSLKRKEIQIKGQLKVNDLTEVEALAIFQEARGILRALLRLRELGKEERDMEGAVLQQRLNNEKRWLTLLRSVGRLK